MIRPFANLFRTAPRRPSPKAVLTVTALDDRILPSTVPVGNTGMYPFSTAVRIQMYWDTNRNGYLDATDASFVGTGTMIGRNKVLTAAHCLYDNDPSTLPAGYATWVRVAPGLDGDYEPFGASWATRLAVPVTYARGAWTSDLGVITLGTPLGDRTGWLAYGALTDPWLRPGQRVNLSAYPADRNWGFDGTIQYFSNGPVAGVNSQVFTYWYRDIATTGGSSGGGVYAWNLNFPGWRNNRVLIGVHVRGAPGAYGLAIRLTPTWVQFIRNASLAGGVQSMSSSASASGAPAGSAAQSIAAPIGLVEEHGPVNFTLVASAGWTPGPAAKARESEDHKSDDKLAAPLPAVKLSSGNLDLSDDLFGGSALHGALVA